jgi:hypothetical protein
MTKWTLRHIPTGRVANVFYQDTQPEEKYLAAFRSPGDAEWEIVSQVVDYYEELGHVLANRMSEYPPVSELADALWHQQNGNEDPMTAYLAKCAEVKTRWPKPTPP